MDLKQRDSKVLKGFQWVRVGHVAEYTGEQRRHMQSRVCVYATVP